MIWQIGLLLILIQLVIVAGVAVIGTGGGTCYDGILNQGEDDIDCGGPCADCATCDDGVRNQGETGVDCGGPCDDCLPSCSDGKKNQGEIGIDCGGPCDPCPSCSDGKKNQGEKGVDCGGPCDPCPSCYDGVKNQDEEGIDCGGRCVVCDSNATCDDGVRNQGETGVDCGGPCDDCLPSCSDGKKNQGEIGIDCGGPCDPCPSCSDGKKNQGEKGVDCGGPCDPCPSCYDGVKNQDEEGIDCGGPCASSCSNITAYFVSSSEGSDLNDGTEMSKPWKTIQKVNSVSFKSGDRIFFKKKDIWNETLVIKNSGTEDSVILYTSYGASGRRPRIEGYDTNISTGIKIQPGNLIGIKISGFEIAGVERGIEMGGGADISYSYSVHQTIEDCYIHNLTGNESFAIGGIGADMHILDNRIDYIGGDGIKVTGYDVTIEDNEIRRIGIERDDASAILLQYHADDFRVIDNEIGMSGDGTGNGFLCTDPGSTDGLFEGNDVRNGMEFAYSSSGGDEIVRYNTFIENAGTSVQAIKTSEGSLYHHNIINGYNIAFSVGGNNFDIYNNLIIGPSVIINSSVVANYTFFNNIVIDYGKAYNFPDVDMNGGNWSNNEISGFNPTRVFVDYNGGNYRILSNCSFVDEGYDVGLKKDFYGNAIPSGSAPDIGIHEVAGGKCVPDCSCNETTCPQDQCEDGCGSWCPGDMDLTCTCADNLCSDDTCEDPCGRTCTGALEPDCSGRVCGWSPNSCGICPPNDCEASGQECHDGQCEDGQCEPQCTGRECGTDSCKSICGTCLEVHGTNTCNAAGICNPVCQDDWGNCDDDRTNGCETPLGTDTNCAYCGNACTGGMECIDGSCQIPPCPQGTADCDGNANNGCETDTTSSTSHCSDCNIQCVNAHGSTSCVNSECVPACLPHWGNCDENANNGCETNLNTSMGNCGTCGHACSDTEEVCQLGTCVASECDDGYADCDNNMLSNGCETDIYNDDENCGECGHACGPGMSCTPEGCVCDDPGTTASCDGDDETGCETDIMTEINHCGDCVTVCTGSDICIDGNCGELQCDQGWQNCDGNPADCETDIYNNESACGSCTNICGVYMSCEVGDCVCDDASRRDCDDVDSNGCEVQIGTDDNCADCYDDCETPYESCQPDGASYACVCDDPDTGNCDSEIEGCETDLTSSHEHCGSCGNACAVEEECIDGNCEVTSCDEGWGECIDDGVTCETNLNITKEHCGECGHACGSGEECRKGNCVNVVWMSDLSSWWRFDGNVYDSEGGHDGTRVGPTFAPGKYGQGLMFDGLDDYVDVGDFNIGGDEITLAAWCTVNSFGSDPTPNAYDPRLIVKGTSGEVEDEWFLLGLDDYYVGSTQAYLRMRVQAGGSTTTLNAGSITANPDEWVHFTGVYDGSQMIVYRNGVEVGRMSKSGDLGSSSAPIWIGNNNPGYGTVHNRPWHGMIDEVMIFTTALTPTQVMQLYQRDLSSY